MGWREMMKSGYVHNIRTSKVLPQVREQHDCNFFVRPEDIIAEGRAIEKMIDKARLQHYRAEILSKTVPLTWNKKLPL